MTKARLKVLIAEPMPPLFEELAKFFEAKGFEVLYHEQHKPVDNYQEAMQLIATALPDIAIVNVKLNDAKTGVELGEYIAEHYFTPVIFLNAAEDFPNSEKATAIAANGFIIPAEIPIDKEQLWIAVRFAMPFAELKKKKKILTTSYMAHSINPQEYFSSRLIKEVHKIADTPQEEAIIKWDDIVYIRNCEKDEKKNNILLLQTTLPWKGYLLQKPLEEIENDTPPYFARINESAIINIKKITDTGRLQYQFYIGQDIFTVTEPYRESAIKLVRLFLDDSRFWMMQRK